ncbi:MAG TPA: BTAD domain-containing putative transcriptional regulator [Anaerolineales bacterium]|nr:BTAD domain-containing putative transcriptional regulator [Anaerolineales bacterium]
MLEVWLIGKFEIQFSGEPVLIASRIGQSLFAYLILTAGTSHRREKLAGMFWADSPEKKARAYLRHELWRIRKALAAKSNVQYLIADDMNILFDASRDYWLDAATLSALSNHPSVEELMSALSNYRGELLPGSYEDWIMREREHLHTLYSQKMSQLLALLETEKRWHEMLEWAERWISLEYESESAYQALMIAYEALGDRAKVSATYTRCLQALHELDLEPSETTRALAFKRTSRLNIPIPLTSFIGREKELKEVASLLSESRLVTLTGSGGVGKTRLAIQVVADVMDRFPDGIWFLDLALLNDPSLVPSVLTNLLKLHESGELPILDVLSNYLRFRTALIIFDNCEHLIESCAQLINSLLTSCANLSVLATSREALRLSGETFYRVPSLELAKPGIEPAIENLLNIESMRLFIERATTVSRDFSIGSQDANILAEICRRLDGIPLAIELAAARVNVLSVPEILKRLDDRFNMLTNGLRSSLPRQQTLRAMIEWSYELLSEKEQLLFRRLAVFSGGWTLEAAEEICGIEEIERSEILALLGQLVNKSLIVGETSSDEPRYRRLETIRQFAREQFVESRESGLLRDRHLIYFLKKAEKIEPYLMGTEQSVWLDYLELELENCRLALDRSIQSGKDEESFRLFNALGWFWFIHCHFTEGEEWFRKIMDLRTSVSKNIQAKALRSVAWLYMAKGDDRACVSFHQESLTLYRELGDMKEVSTTLQLIGVTEYKRGFLAKARSYLEESFDISRQVDNKAAMPRVLIHLAGFSEIEHDFVTARRYYEEALALCREIGEGYLTHIVLSSMGDFEFSQKDNLKARQYHEEALRICIKLKHKRTIGDSLISFANILSAENRYLESARLQGVATRLFDETESLIASRVAQIKKSADLPKKHLGEATYWKEFDFGKTLKLEQAVEIALKQ